MHIGIDIGTTNISATVVDVTNGTIIEAPSFPNKRIKSAIPGSYEQDPHEIERCVFLLLEQIKHPIDSITVTGQVHGILYVDTHFKAVSPLLTWLDSRSLTIVDGKTIEEHFYQETHLHLPTGYGLLTHYANRMLNLIPREAVGFCGILEYITGRLIDSSLMKSDPSCLGTYGAYDPVANTFDQHVIDVVVEKELQFPSLASRPFEIAGTTKDGIRVTYPVGDNQAGYFGMVDELEHSALLSIGTSGQISFFSTSCDCSQQMELREFLGLGYLHVGATLSAGKAYETVKNFFKDVYSQFTDEEVSDEVVFDVMKRSVEKKSPCSNIICHPFFKGTRKDAHLKASFEHIDLDNFTMGNMVESVIDGVIKELFDFIAPTNNNNIQVNRIIATGNGVKKNYLFPKSIEKIFSLTPIVAMVNDGAAIGAALVGAVATKKCTMDEKNNIIRNLLKG